MALTPGTRLGAYEVTAAIGEGGMGEVYRATDTTLGRQVAIKILPEAFASDPDRLARFEREAKTLASINHPGIAAIYGVERSAGSYALVMELVDGEDLARRLARGAIPLDEALPIARQIADALEAAHDQGIIHRDMKPANITIRADGTVKVLDFGLAKALDPTSGSGLPPSGAAVTNSPTLTSPALMTGAGMILGTAAYMAPEQARGRAVDRRADIWAFGAVLYEMLTGRRAFGVSSQGQDEDISMTLASVLKDDVKWEALPADTPASIRRLLRRCLERDPKRRLSAIGDARFDLDDSATPAAELPGAVAGMRGKGSRLPWLALGIVTVLWSATLVPAWRYFHVEPEMSQIRFTVPAPMSTAVTPARWYPSISPDGQTVAFIGPSSDGGPGMIWVRPLGADAKPLAGTAGVGLNLIWSPDSRELAFASAGKLKRIDIAGGTPTPICDADTLSGGSWNRNGVIVYAKAQSGGALFLVKAAGGVPTEFANDQRQPEEAVYRRWPVFLPDGTHILYEAGAEDSRRGIYVRSIDGGEPIRLTSSDGQPAYGSGFLVFQRGRTVLAQPFDAVSLRLSGQPHVVAEDVLNVPAQGRGAYAVSSTGVLVYRTGNAGQLSADLTWVDRTGKATGTVGDVAVYNQIRLSPDEKRVVLAQVDRETGFNRVSVLELTSGVTSVLAQESSTTGVNDPLWAPTSDAVAFESMRNNKRDFFRRAVGTSTDEPLLISPENPKWLDDWSSDGRHILFHVPQPGKLSVLSLPDRTIAPVLDSTGSIDSAHFSHDGKWISYNSNETGKWEVSVAAFPGGDHRQQISQHGGGEAWWRGDDREIFYLAPEGKMMSVPVSADAKTGALEFHAPQALFQSPIEIPSFSLDQYSVTRDGQRFLFTRPEADPGGSLSPINVVTNWVAGLK